MKRGVISILSGALGLLCQSVVWAQWTISSHADTTGGENTWVAQIRNEAGYLLEIYRDSGDAVRGRFTLASGLLAFAEKSCPTFQVDAGRAMNLSINNAPCVSHALWAEYILGYIKDDGIESSLLLEIMHGMNMTFRFRLKNGDYGATHFPLQGSKRALEQVIGANITIFSAPG